MQQLMEKDLIIYRKRLGVYAFRSNVGVDIEKAIESRMGEMESRFDLCRSLMDSAEMDYELPKRYNQKFAITRYFQYEIMLLSDFLKLENSAYLFEEKFADGKILLLIYEDETDVSEGTKAFAEISG
mgnify:CR=1 FL=1